MTFQSSVFTNRRLHREGQTPWVKIEGGFNDKGTYGSLLELILVGLDHLRIHLYFWWRESWRSDELEVGVSDELSSEPQEGLLEVVV